MSELKQKYARPHEFDGGIKITVNGFRALSVEEVTEIDGKEPPMKPMDENGKIYRLDFQDGGRARILDMNYPSFRNDLSGKIKKVGEVGILSRTIAGETPKGRPLYKWTWEPIEEDLGDITI